MAQRALPAPSLGLEPGLLPLFRLLTVIRVGLVGLGVLRLTFGGAQPGFLLLVVADGLLLLAYLFWPGLPRRLGRAFLPIALILASVGPVLSSSLLLLAREPTSPFTLLWSWQLLPPLLIPVVLAAWQYGFRASLLILLGSTLLDVLVTTVVGPLVAAPLAATTSETQRILMLGFPVVWAGRTTTLLVVAYMVSRLMQGQREQRAALAEANARLLRHAATLEQLTISRERNRLARELHDTLAHSLSAMAVQLEATDALWDEAPDEARKLLCQALSVARSGLGETRRALHALRATPLEDLGLSLAVKSLADSLAARTEANVVIDIAEAGELSPPVEQCVYRVAQEALENVARHADARQVQVSLRHTNGSLSREGQVVLTVIDDGRGFDPSSAADERFGLRGMRERAEMVGGALEIVSAPGQGTTVRLTVED